MKPRIKILQLHPDYNIKPCDVSDLGEQIVKALPTDRYEVTVAYLSGAPEAGQPASIAERSHYFGLPPKAMEGLRLKALWQLYRYCAQQRFDVIICNRFKTVSLMLVLNKWLKIPLCIGISHVMDEYRRTYRHRQVGLLADSHWHFVGVSDAVKAGLLAYRSGFTAANTHCIPNAIDIQKAVSIQLDRTAARKALGLPHDMRIIGCIGQLFARKGHQYLIRALASIQQQHPDAHIAIIGRGREQENLQTLIASLGLQDKVHLLGFRQNALQYVRAFDIFAMPSLKEGLPLALMEGMSGALPVIASDIPEMRDLILNAGGLAVPPQDVEALTQALATYLALEDVALHQKGRQVFEYLNLRHRIEDYRTSYRTLIESMLLNNP